ncbi:prenyltransferase/squalene oxidase repeat-containing protein [Micromonospora craterilacus]|nr:prenyltransferase/squalene oxidase repeat-containing protein [Micromonospora craterilacus]
MTTVDGWAVAQTPTETRADVHGAADDLVAEMMREPDGRTSPSVYETARLVSLAPWLAGHAERVWYLLDTQRPDGGWGPPGGYALVPTLSATEALTTALRSPPSADVPTLARAVERGLDVLSGLLRDTTPLPDTPAVDLIVPALIDGLNQHLTAEPWRWPGHTRLDLPPGMSRRRIDAVRQLVASGAPVPDKLLHALEVVADLAPRARRVAPVPPGTVGASPAATAAWLGGPDRPDGSEALAYLEDTVRCYGGPVPCATPVTVFERSWVTSTLARSGIALTAPPGLISSLTANLGAAGTATGPGLPADADTTSVTLVALGRLGAPVPGDCLWSYETDEGFCTWPGEDGFSVTTNAHVLDALGHLAARGEAEPRHHAAVRRLVTALPERQDPQGSWSDRWHASRLYATACCVLALAEFGSAHPTTAEALARAVDWTLATQRGDGSWGTWAATAEETAYAVQILMTGGQQRPAVVEAVRRGYAYLCRTDGQDGPALWHDKDLYQPTLIVRATVIGARYQALGWLSSLPVSA